MVKVGKLWGNARFASLSPISKLLYLYFVTHPTITTLGVLELNYQRVLIDTGIKDKDEYRDSVRQLVDNGYVNLIDEAELFHTFVIKEHFLSLSKSKLNLRKAIDEGKSSMYRNSLRKIYRPEDFKPPLSFVPPTPDQVTEYALSLGYIVNGKKFVDYYASNDWYNKNNKKLRSWKLTLERVWCREENKLTFVKGAPEGYEYFHITLENGDRLSPQGWRNGKPTHSNYLHAELLNEEFSTCTKAIEQQKNT